MTSKPSFGFEQHHLMGFCQPVRCRQTADARSDYRNLHIVSLQGHFDSALPQSLDERFWGA